MEPTYLDTIIESHRRRAALDSRDWRARAEEIVYEGPPFANALRQGSSPFIKVIAEVKRRSPSKGWLGTNLDPGALARIYRDGDATAVSVLTDSEFFAGSLDDLRAVRRAIGLPLLRKDFTVCENDVLDAAEEGAGAVLLIVAALSDTELTAFVELAHRCGIDALVEVHTAEEATRALEAGARIIGVNQRDLQTFEIDPVRTASIVGELPLECLIICESGLKDVGDVERAAQAGFDAVLIGEALVIAPDPGTLLKSFSLVPSVPRG
jgi:indole-3-glycerol phosphate synthase